MFCNLNDLFDEGVKCISQLMHVSITRPPSHLVHYILVISKCITYPERPVLRVFTDLLTCLSELWRREVRCKENKPVF